MAKRSTSAERDYYVAHTTGTSAQTPFGQLQRTFMMQYIQNNEPGMTAPKKALVQAQPFDELILRWLKVWITANGGTPPSNRYLSSHWMAAVSLLGKPVSKYVGDNQTTFFLNAA